MKYIIYNIMLSLILSEFYYELYKKIMIFSALNV